MFNKDLITVKYNIKGMDCPSCANKIETYCHKMSGVHNANLNYSTATLTLSFLKKENPKEKVEKGIKSLGFQISEKSSHIKINNNEVNVTKKLKSTFAKVNDGSKFYSKFKTSETFLTQTNKQVNHSSHKTEHNHSHDHDHDKNNWLPILILSIAFIFAMVIEYYSKNIGVISFTILTILGLLPILKKSWVMMKVGYIFSVETLMSISALGAIFIGAAEEAAAVLILFMIGETLEGYSAKKAQKGIQSLASLLPDTSILIKQNGTSEVIKSSEIKIGDFIEVKPGERLAIDGKIFKGTTNMDESLLTGESLPVYKTEGDKVVAGSINTDGNIIVEALLPGNNNAVTRMVKMVEEAQSSKTRIMRSIERFSRVYTPIILLIGTLTAVIPPLFLNLAWNEWIYRGLTILLIGCPCALVISTPSAIAAGITAATKMGILIKNASAIESLGKITKIAFDKTGTITHGKLKVTDIVPFTNSEFEILRVASMVESKSTHPLANAITNEAALRNINIDEVINAKNLAGRGASAQIQNQFAVVCSPIYASEITLINPQQMQQILKYQQQGKTIAVLLIDNIAQGFIALADTLKQEAQSSIEKLKKLGISTIILTGDNKISAYAIAGKLNAEIRAELLPEQKLNYIQSVSKTERIAMVGDGINDAPAIAAAEIGIAMGSGTDVAVDTSQIVISKNNIGSVVDAITLSRKIMFNIKQNIFLAIGLKVIFLVLTIFGDTQLWMAILADTGATVLVTLNALRLLNFKG